MGGGKEEKGARCNKEGRKQVKKCRKGMKEGRKNE